MFQAPRMTHYCQRNPDGLIHVTNMVGGMTGQHHVHGEAEFKKWSENISESAIDWESLKSCEPCDCGQV